MLPQDHQAVNLQSKKSETASRSERHREAKTCRINQQVAGLFHPSLLQQGTQNCADIVVILLL